MTIQQPYLLFLGDAPDPLAAKVAQGIKDWRPGLSIGQITLPGCKADMGLKNLSIQIPITTTIGNRKKTINRGGTHLSSINQRVYQSFLTFQEPLLPFKPLMKVK